MPPKLYNAVAWSREDRAPQRAMICRARAQALTSTLLRSVHVSAIPPIRSSHREHAQVLSCYNLAAFRVTMVPEPTGLLAACGLISLICWGSRPKR